MTTVPAAPEHLRECPDCGLFQTVPTVRRGHVAECVRCGSVLHRARSEPMMRSLALSLAGLAMFVVAVSAPFLDVRISGQERTTTLADLPSSFELQGLWELDGLVLLTTVLAPGAVLLMTLIVVFGLRSDRPPLWLPVVARWREWLRPWAMTEVFLLGTFVAYTRLAALATVDIGVALYALGGLMLMMIAADALLDHEALWEALGRRCRDAPTGPGGALPSGASRGGALIGCDSCGLVVRARAGTACPRCDAVLRVRKPDSIRRTWSLLFTAAVLYVPANFLPILTVIQLGSGHPSTILGGAQELLEVGEWPLALLVFSASILVPMLKLAALSYMLLATQRGSHDRLRDRTRLYRLVDVIGRWSMIDVFMLSILTALVQMGFLASVVPNIGSVFFGGVVVTTMLAAYSFDPRVMWDRAGAAPHLAAPVAA